MPFESQAQRAWMFANKPEMAKRWAAHTPKGKRLPKRVRNRATLNALNPLKYDPTRTSFLRRVFAAKLKKQFAILKGRVLSLLMREDAMGLKFRTPATVNVANAFCATGQGGGVDDSCGKEGGGESAESKATDVQSPFHQRAVAKFNELVKKIPVLGTVKAKVSGLLSTIHGKLAARYGDKTAKVIMTSGLAGGYGVAAGIGVVTGGLLPVGIPVVNDLISIAGHTAVAEMIHQFNKLRGVHNEWQEEQHPRDKDGRFAGGDSEAPKSGEESYHVALHGTARKYWQSIKKYGLVPSKGEGADAIAAKMGDKHFQEMKVGGRAASVYVADAEPSREDAEMAAQYFSALTGAGNNSQPMVLELHIPENEWNTKVIHDPKDDPYAPHQVAFQFQGTIKPEWITKAWVMPKARVPKGTDPNLVGGMYRSRGIQADRATGSPLSAYKTLNAARTLYALIIFHEPPEEPTENEEQLDPKMLEAYAQAIRADFQQYLNKLAHEHKDELSTAQVANDPGYAQRLFSKVNAGLRQTRNVFCATGEGGGVDPSCGKEDAGGAEKSEPKGGDRKSVV